MLLNSIFPKTIGMRNSIACIRIYTIAVVLQNSISIGLINIHQSALAGLFS